jgi:prevent-host-death family protein
MVTKQVSVAELRANLSDLLGTVYYGKEPVVVERKGKPMAVLISPEQYERYQQDVMERFRQTVDELQRLNADIDPQEGMREVDELVEEVRQELYEREQQADSGNR